MTPLTWPAALLPVQQSFFVRTSTVAFRSGFTGQVQAAVGSADRWVAELTVPMGPAHGRFLEALVAGRRGEAGTALLTDCRYSGSQASPQSFDGFAAEIGTTRFDDGFGFDDGSGFFEGAGQCVVLGGVGSLLLLGGLRPGSGSALDPGDLIQTSPGRGHLVTGGALADIEGRAVYCIAPPLREPPVLGPPATEGVKILMRLVGTESGRNPTRVPWRGTLRLSFEEAL
ncbi:MAG: hypothetical protein GC191_12135 [Azospirillum sp.]|nr:hypothetical protein [Azospirillum sp.]